MPNDINFSTPAPAHVPPAAQEAAAHAETAAESSTAAAKGSSQPTSTLFANPTLQLNADLGIVVIQFRNEGGAVTSQIPSQRQIDAYIAGSASLPGAHSEAAKDPTSSTASQTALQAVSNDA